VAELPIIHAPIDRLTAWYQPIVDLNTGEVRGFEALMRIVEPDGRAHSAGPLIETLEQDLDALLGVVQRLFACLRADVVPVLERYGDFYVSINIPPTVIGTGRLRGVVEAHDLAHWGRRFVVELTERQALSPLGRAAVRLAREAGIAVAVDDFGTGHSSLATLRRLPAQELKIDRAFVVDMVHDNDARAIVEAVLTMARTLGLRVVAEGVETPAQRDLLVQLGCDELQGYLFAKPMSARAIVLWAMDAPSSLAQTFRPSLFKDTQVTGSAPTEFMTR